MKNQTMIDMFKKELQAQTREILKQMDDKLVPFTRDIKELKFEVQRLRENISHLINPEKSNNGHKEDGDSSSVLRMPRETTNDYLNLKTLDEMYEMWQKYTKAKDLEEHNRNNVAKVSRMNNNANAEREQKKEQERIEKEHKRRRQEESEEEEAESEEEEAEAEEEEAESEEEKAPSSPKKKSKTEIIQQKKLWMKIMKKIIDYADEYGRVLSVPFMELPSSSEWPDYYDVIKKPLAIKIIINKIEDGKYTEISNLERDFFTVCANAQTYNEEQSLIYADAVRLRNLFIELRRRYESGQNLDGSDDNDKAKDLEEHHRNNAAKLSGMNNNANAEREQKKEQERIEKEQANQQRKERRKRRRQEDSEEEEVYEIRSNTEITQHLKLCKKIMKKVVEYTDESGQVLSEPFMELPSSSEWPDYYDIITNPLDIKIIINRLENGKYGNISELKRDFFTLCANAKMSHTRKSSIYEASVRLRNLFIELRRRYESGQNSDDSDDNDKGT